MYILLDLLTMTYDFIFLIIVLRVTILSNTVFMDTYQTMNDIIKHIFYNMVLVLMIMLSNKNAFLFIMKSFLIIIDIMVLIFVIVIFFLFNSSLSLEAPYTEDIN